MNLMSQRRGRRTASGSTAVAGDGHLGKIGQQVGEQDLLGQQRQEGQEKGCARHAEHVSEIGAGRHEDVLERIGKSDPPLLDSIDQHRQILFQQDNISRFLGHVRGALHGNAYVGRMERRSIVDPVAHVADDIPGLF